MNNIKRTYGIYSLSLFLSLSLTHTHTEF